MPTPLAESVELERQFEPAISSTGRYPQYRDNVAPEGFQLSDYWHAIRKRLWLVIGIAVLMTTLAAIYMARKPNIYQARAVVQVDLEQNNPDVVQTAASSLSLTLIRHISTLSCSYWLVTMSFAALLKSTISIRTRNFSLRQRKVLFLGGAAF